MGRRYLKAYVNALRQFETDRRLLDNLEKHTCWPYGRRLKGLPQNAIRSKEILKRRIRRTDLIIRRFGEKIAKALGQMEDRIGCQYIEMRYLQGLPMEEIAYIVGYSERQLYRLTRSMERDFLRHLAAIPGTVRRNGIAKRYTYDSTKGELCKGNH